MSKGTLELGLNFPPDMWEQTGDEDDPAARLLTSFSINGCMFHLEALAVTEHERDGERTEQRYDDAPGWIMTAIEDSADGRPVSTVEMQGRKYVLIATPYQK